MGRLVGEPKVKHFLGIPPELTGRADDRILLPPPKLLLLERGVSGTMLFRLTEDGSVVGDTWHASDDDAISQVAYEYGNSVGQWVDLPEEVTDVIEFARCQKLL